MRLKEYIKEEYFQRVKVRGKSIEVFKNPSRKEFIELRDKSEPFNTVRFIADDKTKKVYIWPVLDSIHADMYRAFLGSNFGRAVSDRVIIPGVADVLRSGKSNMYSSDWLRDNFLNHGSVEEVYDMYNKFKWVNNYINIDNWFKNIKEDMKDRL